MVEVWIIQGEANTQKSSLARALTGVPGWRGWRIELPQVGIVEMDVTLVGLQERRSPFTPSDYVTHINQTGRNFALVCLRMCGTRQCPFNATDYEQHFVQVGWNVNGVVSLGNVYQGAITPSFQVINAPQLATNHIAQQVRTQWQWI